MLCIQGTTELGFNGQEKEGLSQLIYETRRGMYSHPTYTVTPKRGPLGVLDAWKRAREKRDVNSLHAGRQGSTRWTEGYEQIAEMGPLNAEGATSSQPAVKNTRTVNTRAVFRISRLIVFSMVMPPPPFIIN